MIINTTPNDFQYFTSRQKGAPQMRGRVNGDLLSVLDACLLTGWGSQQALSAELLDGVMTITFAESHGFLNKQLINVTGFTDDSLDGVYRSTFVAADILTIKTPSALSAEGVLTVKLAPLGWESIFGSEDPLKRAYRSTAAKPNNRVLFLDMSYPESNPYHGTSPATRAMVSVCEDMQILGVPLGDMTSSINNFAAYPNGSLFWYQKRNSTSTASPAPAIPTTGSQWRLVGNGDVFYFFSGWSGYAWSTESANGQNVFDIYGFGRFADLTEGARSDCFLMAQLNRNDNTTNSLYIGGIGSAASTPIYTFSLNGQAETSTRTALMNSTAISGSTLNYPSTYGNSLFATPYRIYTGGELRGFLYSFMFLDSAVDANTYDTEVLDEILTLPAQSSTDSGFSSYKKSVAFYIGS